MKTKYETILGEIGAASTKRTGVTPDEIVDKYSDQTDEALFREACCQILADESPEVRAKFFLQYPELEQYYPMRIQR